MTRSQLLSLGALSLLSVWLTLGGPPSAAQDRKDAAYMGSKSCRRCHLAEFRSWEQTKMAHAFELLAPGQGAEARRAAGLDPQADYRGNPDCVRCHAVGWGRQGGLSAAYDVAADPERLLGVGCESCHGPGGAYLGAGKHDRDWAKTGDERRPALEAAGYVARPGQEVCSACHNQDSPSFHGWDYEARKADGLHGH